MNKISFNMNLTKGAKFLIATVFCTVFLNIFSFDETRLAVTRAEKELSARGFYSHPALAVCSEFQPAKGLKEEALFRRRFHPNLAAGPSEKCQISILSATVPGELWPSQWSFAVRVQNGSGQNLAEEKILVGFPKPIALLPLVLYVMALVLDMQVFSPFLLGGIYLFVLSGMSLVSLLEVAGQSLLRASTDRISLGLLLILFWAILLHRRMTGEGTVTISNRFRFPQLLSCLVGIWNPAVFSIFSRFALGGKSRMSRVMSFCGIQAFLAALSLYLFMGIILGLNENFAKSLYLPRYFSFLLFFSFLFMHWRERHHYFSIGLPNFSVTRGLVSIGLTEALFRFMGWESAVPTLVRIGGALFLSELPSLWRIDLSRTMKTFGRLASGLLLSMIVLQASEISGLFDTAFILVDPALHPNNPGLVTFVASVLMGFLGGSFAFAYFAVGDLLTISQQTPLIRAAVLDGCLIGTLFSPFSLWNLLPYLVSRQPFGMFLLHRYRSISFAFIGAIVIYSIDIIKTVEILRPLVFVFVVMLGLSLELKRNGWQLHQESNPA